MDQQPTGRRRARSLRSALLAAAVGLGALASPAGSSGPAGALPGDVGQEGQAYVEGTYATVLMAESKLWYHDGSWFAAMLRTGEPSSGGSPDADVVVYKRSAGGWVATGAVIDVRGTTKQDVVAVGGTVYVASHKKRDNETSTPETNPSNFTRVTKLAYDDATDQYRVVSGFPKDVNTFQMEAFTIDVDPTGAVWAAWVQADRVMWQRSTDGGVTWSAPAALGLPQATTAADDIAAVVAYGDRVGIMWSSQVAASDGYWFTSTPAGAGAPTWTAAEPALTGAGTGDDHISLKAVGGQVLAAVKARTNGPGIALLRRTAAGTWSSTSVWQSSVRATRPVVVTDGTTVHVLATAPVVGGGQGIHTKSAPLSTLAFTASGVGTPAMVRPTTGNINDVTTTKQVLPAGAGVVAVASDADTLRYWTHVQGGAAPVVPPSAPASATAQARPGAAVVTFGAATAGSAPITGYRITATPALPVVELPASAAGTPQVVPAPNGVARTFHVQAVAGATLGPTRSTAPVTPSTHLPFPSAGAFADRQAADFLGRALTAGERSAVLDLLGPSGQPGAAVVVGPHFLGSPEVGGEGLRGPQASVMRLYLAYFLRPADTTGFTYWMDQLEGGWSLEQMSQHFARSAEFRQRYGALSDADFVRLVYRNLFDRAADQTGLDYWVQRLSDGMPRGRLMTHFSESPENRQRSEARVTVALAHRWMLGEMPTKAQLTQATASGTAEEAVQQILLSTAYRQRVGL